ncbi:MAG: tRNA pseudouridine(55) synthase TruB [Candidatus Pacebacteria bacterium]|nr:tRNA pseudouridine(55) synthase TruB [Melioribacteraceae bacterium]MCK5590356.1 tRNA pseudouridine(55) synthase TruB [Candidatus Paceibacterota bacterium]
MKMITKKTKDINNLDFSLGEVLFIDKEKGFTSFDIIYKIRKLINVKKVGHAGTLDPAATGLLIICTGKKTKEIYKYQNLEKTYTGIIEIGKSTPSMDGETEFEIENNFDNVTDEMIEDARINFVGEILQMPPMYSALKHKGKALYKYARAGVEVERKERKVFISEFEITQIDLPEIKFKIRSSKGTYIRAIANDFGNILGCGAYLKSLRRTAIGEYSVEDALTVDEFRNFFEVSLN